MRNSKALDFFENMARTRCDDPKAVKISAVSDFTTYDAGFIRRFADRNSSVLDLGTGSGMTINNIYGQVGHITAVEPFEAFSQHIVSSPNIEVVNATIGDFVPGHAYDVVTLFGVLQYFNRHEASDVYTKFFPFVKPGGVMIVKNQFGVKEDVLVNGYSEELRCEYYSHYRTLDNETQMLLDAGFTRVDTVDIYPPECNRWDNTHFYALVAYK